MSEVHRYKVMKMLSGDGNRISYDPYGPDVVLASTLDLVTAERDALQQRLTVAEQRVQRMVDCSKGKDSVATGYLSDILALLKPAAEGEGS